jgi:hypothetical protein
LRMCSRGVLLTRAMRIRSASSPTITAAGGGMDGNYLAMSLNPQAVAHSSMRKGGWMAYSLLIMGLQPQVVGGSQRC